MTVLVTSREVSRELLCLSYGSPNQNGTKKGSTAQITSPPSIIGGFWRNKCGCKGELQETNSMHRHFKKSTYKLRYIFSKLTLWFYDFFQSWIGFPPRKGHARELLQEFHLLPQFLDDSSKINSYMKVSGRCIILFEEIFKLGVGFIGV